MLLAMALEPGSRYRLYFDPVFWAQAVDVELAHAGLKKVPGARQHKSSSNKAFLFEAKYFEADDTARLLTFWQPGPGVSVELGGHVSYDVLQAFEPLG